MKKILIALIVSGIALTANAQTTFHPLVKVEFEKVVYVRQLIKAIEPEWYEIAKDRLPEKTVT